MTPNSDTKLHLSQLRAWLCLWWLPGRNWVSSRSNDDTSDVILRPWYGKSDEFWLLCVCIINEKGWDEDLDRCSALKDVTAVGQDICLTRSQYGIKIPLIKKMNESSTFCKKQLAHTQFFWKCITYRLIWLTLKTVKHICP